MLRREVGPTGDGTVVAGPGMRVEAADPTVLDLRPGRPEPLPPIVEGQWRRLPEPPNPWQDRVLIGATLLVGLLGPWSVALLVPSLAVVIARSLRKERDPEAPFGLTITEVLPGTPDEREIGSDSGEAFLDGDALVWAGHGCSFRIGGQDVRWGRAAAEGTFETPPTNAIDVVCHGRRLRLRLGFPLARKGEEAEIRKWARRRPVERGPREAPPHLAPPPAPKWREFLAETFRSTPILLAGAGWTMPWGDRIAFWLLIPLPLLLLSLRLHRQEGRRRMLRPLGPDPAGGPHPASGAVPSPL